MKSLPKMFTQVWIEFDSLRNQLGSNYGMILDCDTRVRRKCRRVFCDGGWCWQIVDFHKIAECDYFVETDRICLEEAGTDCTEIVLLDRKGGKQ